MNGQNGKGDAPRPYNGKRYRENYEIVFPRDTTRLSERADREFRGKVVDGREYLGRGGWKCTDKCECQLRDERT